MKKYKVYYHYPDNPLPISQDMLDRSSKGLKNKMEKYFKFVLPKAMRFQTHRFIFWIILILHWRY